MTESESRIRQLLDRVCRDDEDAASELLGLFRARVRRLVSIHVDARLVARVDPSDVVQDALLAAAKRLKSYARDRQIAFYPWLRDLTLRRLMDIHRRHVGAQRRAVGRELSQLPSESASHLIQTLMASGLSPSAIVSRKEQEERLKGELAAMAPVLRDVILMKYFEGLSTAEIAVIQKTTDRTVRRRHTRAIEHLACSLS